MPSAEAALPRLAVVSHSHPSITKGGAEIAAHTLFRGLRALGRDVIFIGCCPEEERSRLDLGSGEHAVFYRPQKYDHFYHTSQVETQRQLLVLLQAEQVEEVNFHHFLHIGASAVRTVSQMLPSVFTFHEFLSICQHYGQMVTRPGRLLCSKPTYSACANCFPEHSRQQFAMRQMTMLHMLENMRAYVSPSHFLAERFVRWGLDGAKMHVIENGMINHDAQTISSRRDLGEKKPRWRIGFFGQMNPFKGIDLILAAADLLALDPDDAPPVEFRIYGNFVGVDPAFRTRFDEATARHRFLQYFGPYDNSQVRQLMGECDYILVPSKWWENSPMVIQEAYSAGRPVICTGIGGMAEKVVPGRTGLHFRLNDPADLVSTIRTACDAAAYNMLIADLPEVSTSEKMAQDYSAVFAQAFAPRGAEPVLAEPARAA